MAHTCDGELCPPQHVNGTKANCFGCKKICFLGCYGISNGTTQTTAYEKILRKNDQPFTSKSNVQFVCNDCLIPANSSLNDSTNTPKAEKLTIKGIMQEVAKLQDRFASFQLSSTEMNKKLESIDVKTTDIKSNTEAVLTKVNSKSTISDENNTVVFGSSSLSTRLFRPQLHRKTPTYASVTGANGNASQLSTPSATKRPRNETPNQMKKKQKLNVPEPKTGTNASASGLVAVVKPEPKKITEKPKFDKAVWVSRLAPSTTEEHIRQHIAEKTPASSNFTVHKLVKKDCDQSKLNFVSFKIAVNMADFDILNDPCVWPQNVLVREFMEVKPITVGEFLPTNLNEKSTRKSPEPPKAMQATS